MRKIRILQFGIGTLINSSPLLSSDSKYLFTIGDDSVYVWIVETGECLRKLVDKQGKGESPPKIVSIALNPHNRLQILVAFETGSIDVWDYEDGFKIQTIESSVEIQSIRSIANVGLYLFGRTTKNVHTLLFYKNVRNASEATIVFDKLPCQPKSVSFDEKGNLLTFINQDGNHVYLVNLSNKQIKCLTLKKNKIASKDRINLSQMHPQQQCLALALDSGRILLWFDFLDPLNDQSKISYLHWHSLPVLSLSFSADGSFLYSGGHECVLVKWLFQSQEPHFRPRLGSPIIGILPSADQTFTVTVHSDNTLQIIGSNLTIRQTIAGFNKIHFQGQTTLPTGLHLFKRQRSIVTNSGKPGHLQFISIDDGKLVYQLDIVGENYVSPADLKSDYQWTEVKRLDFDQTENWLATFEERSSKSKLIDDDQTERKLRFWKFVDQENKFELNTSITYPHGQKTINALVFHPQRSQLGTSGDDGFVKLWLFVDHNPLTKMSSHWRCLSAFAHRSYRSSAICFYRLPMENDKKDDGWFLCASFEHLVKVWAEQTSPVDESEVQYQYSKCLSHFDRHDRVQSIVEERQCLFVVHKSLVNLWDCRTGIFLRSFHWNVHSVSQDRFSSSLIFFEKKFVHIYSLIDGKCQTRKNRLFRQVESSICLPSTTESDSSKFDLRRLLFFVADQGFKTMADENDEDPLESIVEDSSKPEEKKQSNLSKLIENSVDHQLSAKRKRSLNDETHLVDRSNKFIENQFLCTASYLLPSIDRYSIRSMKEMLVPLQKSNSSSFDVSC